MTKLKLKTTPTLNVNENDHAHVPSFIQPTKGSALSVQFKTASDRQFTERWIGAKAYTSEAEPATPFETEVYSGSKDADFLASMNEPDPIAVHTADEWSELTEADFSDVADLVA